MMICPFWFIHKDCLQELKALIIKNGGEKIFKVNEEKNVMLDNKTRKQLVNTVVNIMSRNRHPQKCKNGLC